ncbi:hypothetical protein OEZ85_005022 [Tetradesmus obliquus]|uniref:Uncharacterized protein n=1 Tax=Tetradesmus obliquus TaxID=3088 RepID=A0ABY8UK17_TETOB|nr:hypothetical protein OEZ85_005022 [Tetradesmus obliquus]
MRSQLLFEAPDTQQEAAAASKASTSLEEHHQQQQQQQQQPQQQQQRPASPAWGGAVDLNPAGSFTFPPKTPERLAATCPDELPLVLSHFTTLLHDIQDLDHAGTLGQLHHREVLQAGIAQLNGEFYGALLRAAGKQHEAEMRRANRQDAHAQVSFTTAARSCRSQILHPEALPFTSHNMSSRGTRGSGKRKAEDAAVPAAAAAAEAAAPAAKKRTKAAAAAAAAPASKQPAAAAVKESKKKAAAPGKENKVQKASPAAAGGKVLKAKAKASPAPAAAAAGKGKRKPQAAAAAAPAAAPAAKTKAPAKKQGAAAAGTKTKQPKQKKASKKQQQQQDEEQDEDEQQDEGEEQEEQQQQPVHEQFMALVAEKEAELGKHCIVLGQFDGDEDEATIEDLVGLQKVFVPEQVQDDFIELWSELDDVGNESEEEGEDEDEDGSDGLAAFMKAFMGKFLGTQHSGQMQAILSSHLKAVDKAIKAKQWQAGFCRWAAIVMAARRESHWWEDTDKPAAATVIYNKLRTQWGKLKERSDEELGGLVAEGGGCPKEALGGYLSGMAEEMRGMDYEVEDA